MSGSHIKSELVQGAPAPLIDGIGNIISKRRICIPKRLCKAVDWIQKTAPSKGLLILDNPGQIRILSIEDSDAQRVTERYKELADAASYDFDAKEAFKLLKDRYEHCQIPTDGRLLLSEKATVHLISSLSPKDESIFLFADSRQIELCSKQYRDQIRARSHSLLEDLP